MFNPEARSPVGAEGLMQLMPSTAKGVAKKLGMRFKPGMLTDTDYNVRLGTAFVQSQLDGFEGSYVLALAGYNAGEGAVEAHGGVPPFAETQSYVRRILSRYPSSRHPYDASVAAPSKLLLGGSAP